MSEPRSNLWRTDKLTPEEDVARLERIRAKTERMTPSPNDSRVDYDRPEFRGVSPEGWTRRLG